MSADRPDPRNPLARALDEASSSAEAHAFSVPVDGVRRRAGRRRTARTAGTAAVALVVVVGVGTGLAAGLDAWRDGSRTPGVGETVAPAADWPGQFAYCGQPVDAVYTPMSSARLVLDPLTETMPADGDWSSAVTTEVASVGEDVGWVWGTDLLVVQDGVVVGVQDGAPMPPVQDLDAYLGGAAPSFATAPFPLVTDVSAGLASCDQYPSGQGDPRLSPGTYDLVVAQTISYLRHSDGARVDLRLGTQTTVTITEAPAAPEDRPAACGASDEQLTLLSNPQSNPAPFGVAAVAHPSPAGYDAIPLTPTVTNIGSTPLQGWTGQVRLVVTWDGTVVGGSAVTADGTHDDVGRLDPGESVTYGDPPAPEACGGGRLAPGDYELWLLVDAGLASGENFQAASPAMPWTIAPERPTSEPSEAQTAAWVAQRDALFPCGMPTDASAVSVALGTSSAQPRTTPVGIGFTNLGYDGSAEPPADWSVSLTPFEADEADVDVLAAPTLAFVGADGRVAGFSVPSSTGIQRGTVGGEGLPLGSGTSVTSLVACRPDGSTTSADDGLPAGAYDAYPLVPVVVTRVVSGGTETTNDAGDPAGVVLLVGPPRSVGFGGAAVDPVADLFRCNRPVQVFQDMFTEGVLSLTAELPATGWATGVDSMPAWSAELRANGGAHSGETDGFTRLAFTDAAGTVVGRTVSGDWFSQDVTLSPGKPLTLDGYGWPAPCRADGTLGGKAGDLGHMWLPAGTYWAYPFVTFSPNDDDGSGTWVVVGAPSKVTFTAQ